MQTRFLTGITWNHTRGYLPLAAAAQRFAARDPSVEIVWHKRSLPEFAVAYLQFVASPDCQRGLNARSGGEPGHRGAWTGLVANGGAGKFSRDTPPTLDEAYLRPRYRGYVPFQDRAGDVVHAYLRDGGAPRRSLAQQNRHDRASRTDERA